MHRIYESILDDYTPSEDLSGAQTVANILNDSTTDKFPSEFAKSSSDLIIKSSTTALQIKLFYVQGTDTEELKRLLWQAGLMYMHILDYSTFISERSKVFPQANFELEGFDNLLVGSNSDVLSLTCCFAFTNYAKPIDAAKLLITLLRNFIKFEDEHSDKLSKVVIVLRIRSKNGRIFSYADDFSEDVFEEHIDNGLNYEAEHAFDFMSALMHYINRFFPTFKHFDAEDWQRLYVNGKYDIPFYQQLHNYLKREKKRWRK